MPVLLACPQLKSLWPQLACLLNDVFFIYIGNNQPITNIGSELDEKQRKNMKSEVLIE